MNDKAYLCDICGQHKTQKKRFCVHGEWWCNKCHQDYLAIFGEIMPFKVQSKKTRNEIDGMIRSMVAI